MTERMCVTCGKALFANKATGRPRKYCSERCRKLQYGDPCVECGAKTRYGAEATRVPTPRCDPCARRRRSDHRVTKVLAILELRRTTQLTNVAIGRKLGIPAGTVRTELHRLRALGFEFPVSSYNGSNRRVEHPVCDAQTWTLAAALSERGHQVPAMHGQERAA